MRFSKGLKKNDDFRLVYRRGRSAADRRMVLYVMKNGTSHNRLGISVSRKYGNSVARHRFKRRIREIYRLHEASFAQGQDLVVVARTGGEEEVYQALEQSLLRLRDRLHAGAGSKERREHRE